MSLYRGLYHTLLAPSDFFKEPLPCSPCEMILEMGHTFHTAIQDDQMVRRHHIEGGIAVS